MPQNATTGQLQSAQNIVIAKSRYTMEHNAPMVQLVEMMDLPQGAYEVVVPKVGQFTFASLTDGLDLTGEQSIGMGTVTLSSGEVGAKIILLPFDAQGVLVPDDGKTDAYQGRTVDDKPVIHQPLYNTEQRALVERMKKAASRPAPTAEEIEAEAPISVPGEATDPADAVNFASWLRGEVRYTPQELRAAAKSRFHVQFVDIKELVIQAVLDEKIVPEDQVCPALAVYLPKAA